MNGETSMRIINMVDVPAEKKTYDEALRFVSNIQMKSKSNLSPVTSKAMVAISPRLAL